jgi:SLA1 homology domain 1, SHD1
MPEESVTPAPVANKTAVADEVFGAPPSTASANEPSPMPASPAGADDLFGSPTATAVDEPAQKSPPAASTGGGFDDLFGSPAPATDGSPSPAAEKAGDDLFNSPAPSTTEPSAPKDKGLDDLFNMKEAPETDSVYPPVSEPARPLAGDSNAAPDFEKLFGNPSSSTTEGAFDPKTANEPKAPEAGEPKKSNENFDDLFKTSSAPANPEFRGAEFRTWTDNTGDYRVKGRLVMIYPDRIRLLKDNGKYSTVPYTRLSETDQDYVNWVAVSLTGGPKTKFVNTDVHGGDSNKELSR